MPKKSRPTTETQIDELSLLLSFQFGRAWLGVPAPGLKQAKQIRRQHEEFLQYWACESGYEECRIFAPDGNYVRVSASNTTSQPQMLTVTPETLKSVFTNDSLPITREMWQVMEQLIQADRPMGLNMNEPIGTLDADSQIWVNQLAADMLQSAGKDCTVRNIKKFWRDIDHEALYVKLRDTSLPFHITYSAKLNDPESNVWFEATNLYTPVTINGRSFRLGIVENFEIIGATDYTTVR